MSDEKKFVPWNAEPPTYRLRQVGWSLVVFYLVCLMFDARGLYNWTQKLAVSETTRFLRTQAEKHWAWTSKLGLEEPKHTLEHVFLSLQDAHPLLFPRKYADIQQRKLDKEKRKKEEALAAKKNPKLLEKKKAERELVEDDERVPETAAPKVLVVGDSIMMSVGPVIKKDVAERLGGAAIVKAKLATGLARPDVFDWPKEVRRLTARRAYDYVVLMFGTNDSQDFVESGKIMTYGTSGWVEAYNKRLSQVMEAACKGTKKAIWVGLPPMQSEAFNRKAVRINSWAKRQAARHPCMEYVATDTVIGDERGNFVSYRKIGEHLEKIRMVDGIHVTARGGVLISSALLNFMSTGNLPGTSLLSH